MSLRLLPFTFLFWILQVFSDIFYQLTYDHPGISFGSVPEDYSSIDKPVMSIYSFISNEENKMYPCSLPCKEISNRLADRNTKVFLLKGIEGSDRKTKVLPKKFNKTLIGN